MNTIRENVNDLEFRLQINIVESDYHDVVLKELKGIKARIVVPGFRKGNAPMGMIEHTYKAGVVADKVQELVNTEIYRYLTDEKLHVVGSPMLNEERTPMHKFDSEKDFTFVFDLALIPDVKIDWSKVDVKRVEVKVDKKEVDSNIDSMTRQHGKYEAPDEAGLDTTVYGKIEELDKEGNVKEGGISTFMAFAVEDIKDEELRNSFVGKKKDDKVRFVASKAFSSEKLEETFRKDFEAVKKIKNQMELTISGVSKVTPHPIDQDLFDTIYPGKDIKTEAAFRKAVSADISEQYQQQCDIMFANQVRRALIDQFDAPIPEAFLKRWILSRNNELTAEELDKDWVDGYLPKLKWEFIDEALNKIENLLPSHKEIVDEIKSLIRQNSGLAADDKSQEEALERAANSLANDEKNSRQVVDRMYHNKLVALFDKQLSPEVEKVTVKEFMKRVKAENEK